MSDSIPFNELAPTYDDGREQVPVDEARTAEQIMENNPPFKSED